jgi:hypothetical protein
MLLREKFLEPIYGLRTTLAIMTALLIAGASPLHALPGEANAVIAHCGEPHAEHYGTSPVTNTTQRDLIYNDLTLHFEPLEGGWSFTTAWRGHFPVTRKELEKTLPCFRAAMEQVAAGPQQVVDPTIAAQSQAGTPMSTSTWGIPHLWLIVALIVLTLLILFLLPSRRRPAAIAPPDRIFRKPNLRGMVFRRKPRLPME